MAMAASTDCENKANNLSLVVLMGLPASGKSTLANKLSIFCTKWHTIIFSFDNFVPLSVQAQISESANAKLPDGNVQSKSPQNSLAKVLRKKFVHCVDTVARFVRDYDADKCTEKYLQSLNSSLCSLEGTDSLISNDSFLSKVQDSMQNIIDFYAKEKSPIVAIVVDDNNYYSSMRNDFYQVSKQLEIGFCMIHCKTMLKTCVQRNASRPVEVQVPQKAIVEMSLKFEVPNSMQNSCDLYCLQIDLNEGSELNLELLEQIVSNSFSNPLTKNIDRTVEIERERRICSENEMHQADLVLRKWVSKKLNLASYCNSFGRRRKDKGNASSDSGNSIINLSKELNDRKKKTLENLRSGNARICTRIEDIEFRREIIRLFESVSLE